MGAYHVLTVRGSRMIVVCHSAVPATSNVPGIPWRTALVNSGIGGKTVLKDGDGQAGTISTEEKAQVLAGDVHECAVEVDMGADFAGLSLAAKQARVLARAAHRAAEELEADRKRLEYFGFTGGA